MNPEKRKSVQQKYTKEINTQCKILFVKTKRKGKRKRVTEYHQFVFVKAIFQRVQLAASEEEAKKVSSRM